MSKEIKDQTVNSFNAEIKEAISTPELRLHVATTVAKRAFNVVGEVEFHHLKEFDRLSSNLPPSIYWVYTFRCEALTYGDGTPKINTLTLSNYGSIEFNFHSVNISTTHI